MFQKIFLVCFFLDCEDGTKKKVIRKVKVVECHYKITQTSPTMSKYRDNFIIDD